MGQGEETSPGGSPPAPVGVPYIAAPSQPITEWSKAVYEELKDWALAHSGTWERWEPNYLVLTISSHKGVSVEPVVIDTYEDELTVNFGYWEIHLPNDGIYDDTDSHRATEAAKILASDWLESRIATAIYYNAEDKWCGSKLLEDPDDMSQVNDIAWIEDLLPARVEVRKSTKSEWQRFDLVDGKLIRNNSRP